MSDQLRLVGFLDVLSSTPAESSRRAPCFHARLRRLAPKPGEKCELAVPDCSARLCRIVIKWVGTSEAVPCLNLRSFFKPFF